MIQRLARGEPRRESRVISHAVVHRLAADRVRLAYGELTLGGVDDQVNLVVLDHIHDMRPAFAYLVHSAAGDARLRQRARRAFRRHGLEAAGNEPPRKLHRARLVAVAYADEAHARSR